ncbi:MAG: type II toxin-antitoxin system HicB family antitoxin [Methylomonas sp.]|nr:type II toxin-antitoxin system HicB family antitoxin [Methylomonas sp.]
MLRYPVNLIHDSETGSILVEFPDIPWCHSAGDDPAEALLNAEQALESALLVFCESRRAVPMPSAIAQSQSFVALPALVTAKILLWNEMLSQGLRKADLARRLGCHMPQIDRLLDFAHSSKLEQVEAALKQLGKHLDIRLVA